MVGGVLHLTTPQARWAYAVELPLQQNGEVLAAGVALNLRVLVHEGEVGLGLLTADGDYRHEVRVGAGAEAERIDIVLAAGTGLGSLMVRNTSARGRSRTDIALIGYEAAPGPEQPYWTALRTVSNDALCRRVGETLHLTTPQARWASAVEFLPQRGTAMPPAGLAVNLRVLVHDGEVGLGLLTADGGYGHEVHEVRVGAGTDDERVDIVLPPDMAPGRLVVRNTSGSGSSRADIELIGCEAAPGAEQPYWSALRTVKKEAACRRTGDLLHVTTPQAQWASAIEFPPQRDGEVLDTGLALDLRVLVHEGEVGLGLLTADGEYLHEVRVGAGAEVERVDIVLPAGTGLGSLVVRNTSGGGQSRADIALIGSEAAPDPEQPYWTAMRTVSNGAVCRRFGDTLHLTMPQAQWAGAIEFPPQRDAAVCDSHMTLRLRIHVHEGEVAVQILTPSRARYCEVRVGTSIEAEIVEITLPSGTPIGVFAIKNSSTARRSSFDLEVLGCVQNPTAEISREKFERLFSDLSPEIVEAVKVIGSFPFLFSVVSWGCAATDWLARVLNSHPDILCLHDAKLGWSRFTCAPKVNGWSYLRALAMIGRNYPVCGDVHAISPEEVPELRGKLGDRFSCSIVVRDPLPRLHSMLELFNSGTAKTSWNIDNVQQLIDRGVRLPTDDIDNRLFLFGVNMLNSILEERLVAPIWRCEDLTTDSAILASFVKELTRGQERRNRVGRACRSAAAY